MLKSRGTYFLSKKLLPTNLHSVEALVMRGQDKSVNKPNEMQLN